MNDNGDWIVVSRTGFMASETRLIEYLQQGVQKFGNPYSAHMTDTGLVICYERGHTWLGRVPPELKEKVTASGAGRFRVRFLDNGAWFYADENGDLAVRL